MAGIAGVAQEGRQALVETMLEKIAHRGRSGSRVVNGYGSTLGFNWSQSDPMTDPTLADERNARDARHLLPPEPRVLAREQGPFALALDTREGVFLARDVFGTRPLYYGYSDNGVLCFASEIKALLEATHKVYEFPPGTWYKHATGFQPFRSIEPGPLLRYPSSKVARDLRTRLEQAVCMFISDKVMGSWLSGGLDSSVIAALARPHVHTLHTFVGGLPGASDLEHARQVAKDLGCRHHEVVLTETDLLQALPDVIYALESFDTLLVRSTIVNFLVSRQAADWVGAVFSGEGGDELFAGYGYLDAIPAELLDITRGLHNTAIQRVDRSAQAYGLVPYMPFLNTSVAFFALRIPSELKRGPQEAQMGKWILRKAMEKRLPETVLWRRKAKFWEGAGVGVILSQHADAAISDRDFRIQRTLPDGSILNTKEELMYYRLFKEHFGEFDDLSWLGRTKGAPQQTVSPAPTHFSRG